MPPPQPATRLAAARSVYTSPTGNDKYNGSTPATAVQSLHRAQELARSLQPSVASPVTIWLTNGTYTLNATLVLDSRDSFTAYAALPDTRPILSSGIRIPASAFQPVPGRAPGLLSVSTGLPPDPPNVARSPLQAPSCSSGPEDDCALQQDVDFDGNDLDTTTASSPQECCSKCANHTGCKYFTIEHASGGTCWLKSSDAGRRPYADHVSGQPGGGPPPPPPGPFVFGPSPPEVNSVFVNGRRMVRRKTIRALPCPCEY